MTTYKKPDSDAKRVRRVTPTVPTHAFEAKPIEPFTNAQPKVERALYDGKELRPFEGRPGAMDFKKCPSRGLSV